MALVQRFGTIVVGNGLIGAAAGRHLADAGERVAVIGPGEPVDPTTHPGVFASHYDQGRLVSGFGGDEVWAAIGRRAIDAFPVIEARSAIRFHRPVGRVSALALTPLEREQLRDRVDAAGDHVELYEAGDGRWAASCPGIALPADLDVLLERGGAGVIDPRALVRAQNEIAVAAGAVVIEETVHSVAATPEGVVVDVGDRGVTVEAERVLVAAGAFTNVLLERPLPIRWKTETTVWGDVTETIAQRLAGMPAFTSDVTDPGLDDVYAAPPLRYPDGAHRIKLGANTRHESWPRSTDEIGDWFRSGDGDVDLPALERQLRAHVPGVEFTSITSHRCIVTYTPSGFPIIDRAPGDDTGRVFVAAGGNGQGAGGSDTLGLLAALAVRGEPWPAEFPRRRFSASHEWTVTGAGRAARRRAAAADEVSRA